MLVIHIIPVVCMAIDTGKYRVVGCVAVAIVASIPFTRVRPRIYGKKQAIMFSEIGRLPTRHRGVALHTNIVNAGCDMVRIGGGIIVRFMTGKAIARNIGIIARHMTGITIIDGMSLGQREA